VNFKTNENYHFPISVALFKSFLQNKSNWESEDARDANIAICKGVINKFQIKKITPMEFDIKKGKGDK